MNETDSSSSFFPARLARRVLRRRWLIGLTFVLMACAAIATMLINRGQEVSSWTATSIIQIGLVPTFDTIFDQGGRPNIELIETARDLVSRINSSQFLPKVAEQFGAEPGQDLKLLAGSSLRGVALSDSTMRLEATSGSRQGAVSALEGSISLVQKIHKDLAKPRIDIFNGTRNNLKEALNWLTDSSQKDQSIVVQPAQSAGVALVANSLRDLALNRIVDLRLRIGAMNLIERLFSETGPQSNLQPAVEGPRKANLAQNGVLTGLGILFCAIILTVMMTGFDQKTGKDNHRP